MTLVRHQTHQPETRTPSHRAGQFGQLGRGAQRGAAGADTHPAPQQLERGVQLQADPHLVPGALAGPVHQVELRRVVDHHGDGAGELGVPGQLGERRAVGGGIGEQYVLEPGARQPQRLREREGHQAREAGPGEHPLQQRAAAHRLAGHPDRLAGRAADDVIRVGVERLQIDDRHRRVEMSGRPVVPGAVSGAGCHGGSLPEPVTTR